MTLIICPDCGKEQDNLNKFCRNCGADLSKVEPVVNENSDSNIGLDSNTESNSNLDSDPNSLNVPILNEDGTNSNEIVPASSNEDLNQDKDIGETGDIPKCSNCGTELNYGEKFCPNCGQSTDSSKENYPKNFCPNCGGKLSQTEKFCPNCGFDLNNISKNINNSSTTAQNLPVKKEPIVSVILSFVFPGLGQFYNGQSTKGIYFIILAVVSVILTVILIGGLIYILIWLWSIIDAYNSAESINRGEILEDKLF